MPIKNDLPSPLDESEKPRETLEFGDYVKGIVEAGEGLGTLSEEAQKEVRDEIGKYEGVLDDIFRTSIPSNRYSRCVEIEFLSSEDFFDRGVVEAAGVDLPTISRKSDTQTQTDYLNEVTKKAEQITQAFILLMNTKGIRNPKDDSILVHAVRYRPQQKPRLISNEEAVIVGMHELTHAKVQPIYEHLPREKVTARKTGFKIVHTSETGEVIRVLHQELYEAATDLIPGVLRYKQETFLGMYDKFMEDQHVDRGTGEREDALKALCIILDIIPGTFEEKYHMLGDMYFRSDAPALFALLRRRFDSLEPKIEQRDFDTAFFNFISGSLDNNETQMLAAAVNLKNLTDNPPSSKSS